MAQPTAIPKEKGNQKARRAFTREFYRENKLMMALAMLAAISAALLDLALSRLMQMLVDVAMDTDPGALTRLVPYLVALPLGYALVLALGFFAAWILNAYVCPYRCRPSEIAMGSFFTAIAWLVASAAFSVYLAFGDKQKLYGTMALFVVFLIWLYWMMICFTAGVVFNRERMQTRKMEHKVL